MSDSEVKYAGDPQRALEIIKTCATCGDKYHPRKNGYQHTSRFCSDVCAKKGRSLMGFN